MEIKDALAQIRALIEEKKFEEIEDLSWDLMEEHPSSSELLIALGKAAMQAVNFSRADYYFMKAKLVDSSNTEPLFALAELSVMLKDFSRARGYYNDILEADKGNLHAQLGIADTYYAAQLFIDASEAYHQVLNADAKNTFNDEQYSILIYKGASSYSVTKEFEKGLELINEFAPTGFQEMVALAKLKLYQGLGKEHFNDAADCLEALQKNVPTEPDYILQLIPYLEANSNADKLKSLFDALFNLELDAVQKEDALRMRAQFGVHIQDWKAALADFDALIAIKEDWTHYQDRAVVKEQLKDIKGAVQDLSKALSLTGGTTTLYSERGKILMMAKAYDKAIADFQKVLSLDALDREISESLYNIGVAYTKKKDKGNALKSLMKAELMGSNKARKFLMKNFADKLTQLRNKQSAKHKAAYAGEADRNQQSPILSKAIGKLWVPNMSKVFQELEPEMDNLPAKIIKAVMEEAAKDLFLITPEALLLIEGDDEPMEGYYKVVVESEHSILLEVQPSKGGPTSNMRLSFFEGDLLMAYPDAEGGGANDWKYFMNSDKATDDQKNRLTSKEIDVPYSETIEESIASIAG